LFFSQVIDKKTIEPDEKVLLRTEIAVLKLVDHPNIIKMEGSYCHTSLPFISLCLNIIFYVGLYESRTHIYIVMEMLKGGELFERIVGRPRHYAAHYLFSSTSLVNEYIPSGSPSRRPPSSSGRC
jgi:serine/threonine protein kinase